MMEDFKYCCSTGFL